MAFPHLQGHQCLRSELEAGEPGDIRWTHGENRGSRGWSEKWKFMVDIPEKWNWWVVWNIFLGLIYG